MDLITLSIPAFFLLIGVELVTSRLQGRQLYRFSDSVTDLSCGIVNQVIAVFTATALAGLYVFTWSHFRLFDLPAGGWTWALALVGVDLGYYWFHRSAHEHSALWATHVVHHSSEEYNLTVALRQGAVEPLATWVFYQPLALLGVPPALYFTANAVNTLYQFWVHTRAIDRLGPAELVFNTPSHHRVHHGCEPEYLDRNYGGMLVIWDRLFGTFQVEGDEPTYGLTAQLQTFDPVRANLEFPRQMLALTAGRPLLEKVKLWWMAPADLPLEKAPLPTGRSKWGPAVTRGRLAYVLLQFVLMLGGAVGLLFAGDALEWPAKGALGLWVIGTAAVLGRLLEDHPRAVGLEVGRLAVTAVGLLGAVTILT